MRGFVSHSATEPCHNTDVAKCAWLCTRTGVRVELDSAAGRDIGTREQKNIKRMKDAAGVSEVKNLRPILVSAICDKIT